MSLDVRCDRHIGVTTLVRSILGAVGIALLAPPLAAEGLQFGVFGDVAGSLSEDAAVRPAFRIGQMDLFLSARPSPRWQPLCELVFEAPSENTVVVDVERLQIRFEVGEMLAFTAGRMHQALGFFNTAYHHGALLAAPIERPRMVAFEDEGGLLPVHIVGVEASGEVRLSNAGVSYVLGVGNGRGRYPDEIVQTEEVNRDKSVNLLLRLSLDSLGLAIGGNVLMDRIPRFETSSGIGAHPPLSETVAGLHALLEVGRLRVLAEAYAIDHAGAGVGRSRTSGGFLEVSLHGSAMQPYVLVEAVDYPAAAEPFFSPDAPLADLQAVRVGFRWNVAPTVAVKLELQRVEVGSRAWHSGGSQIAFGF